MPLSENGGSGMIMPVAPMYGGGMPYGGSMGGFGFGGDWSWILLLLLITNGGWGMGGFGGRDSYDGGYGNGASGRYQPRNAQGQFKADGYSNRGGSYGSSYHSQQGMIQGLRECMQDATPETQRAYRKVIRDMQEM